MLHAYNNTLDGDRYVYLCAQSCKKNRNELFNGDGNRFDVKNGN